jgi:hypothetical protein
VSCLFTVGWKNDLSAAEWRYHKYWCKCVPECKFYLL